MLLDGEGEVRAALDRRVVADHHDVPPVHETDTGDHARARRLSPVQAVSREGRDLEERAALIEHTGDAIAREQLPSRQVTLARSVRSSARGGGEAVSQFVRERLLGCRHRDVLLDPRPPWAEPWRGACTFG